MTRFNNATVVEMFVQGANPADYRNGIESTTQNLYITEDGKRLFNYGTCLVERNAELGMWIINRTSYSVTTSKIQSYISSAIWQRFSADWINENTITVDNVQISTNYLIDAAKEKIEWSKGLNDYRIVNYFDVWGNAKDGWEINNLCHEEPVLTLHETATNKDVFKALKDCGFFKNTARINQVDIEDLFDFGWEFNQRKDGKPICRVEIIRNKVEA